MSSIGSRLTRWRLAGAVLFCMGLWVALSTAQQARDDVSAGTTVSVLTQVLGRPTDQSIVVNVLAPTDVEAYVEYGVAPGKYAGKTATTSSKARTPVEITVDGLKPNTRYYYRLQHRERGQSSFSAAKEFSFHTQRPAGSTFVFDVQSDSHPERARMFQAELYARTLANVRKDNPDFYISMGDDFSVDEMRLPVTPEKVRQVYIEQRPYLGMDGASAPVFLVNGNHEQAAKYLLDGTPNNNAIWAGNARVRYYPLPAPDRFYTGDEVPVEFVGLIRDYYAWTWGDALFVTIDPYWHSNIALDGRISEGTNGGRGGDGPPLKRREETKDPWDATLGEAQYRWLQKTLSQSKAKYKFIFTHHVLGAGRGGIELATLFEWGGKNEKGVWEFDKRRPNWDLPIHQLMVKYGVTIFFQGHDHVYARQELDGIVYQETPAPADPNYRQLFGDAYRFGDSLPASGHLRVSVNPEKVKVDYIRSWMPKDETAQRKHGEIAFSHSVSPKNQQR